MNIKFHRFTLKTTSATDIIDVTSEVKKFVSDSKIKNGLVTIIIPGSTAAVTTIEYEPGVVEDLKKAIERIAPRDIHYAHDAAWGDGNGYAHVRAALLKASLTIPVRDGGLVLGTWQQIVVCDFDNRPRNREVVVQILGD